MLKGRSVGKVGDLGLRASYCLPHSYPGDHYGISLYLPSFPWLVLQ